jgi:predicted DCC family thiol-disulfide oxidoreductase YuxK
MLRVLYDGECPFCVRCAAALAAARQRVPLVMIDQHDPVVRARYARVPGIGRELIVVAADGRFWIGPAAFVVCLWALERWSWSATLLASPLLRGITHAFFTWLSTNRGRIGSMLGMPACTGGHCGVAHDLAGPYR